MHSRSIYYRTILLVIGHLLFGEGVADNVLGDPFKSVDVIAFDGLAVMHTEPAVFPTEKLPRQFLGKQFFLDQHLDDPHSKHLLQGLCADLRSNIEHSARAKESIGYQSVQVAVIAHVFVPRSRDMDGHNHTELTVRLVCHLSQEFHQALIGNLAKLLEKPAVVPEPTEGRRPARTCRSERSERQLHTEHNGQAENVLAVRQRVSLVRAGRSMLKIAFNE
jgi:hypothetical protein